MNSIRFIDYIKYKFFNVRKPEIVEKMRLKELANSISKYKYNFIDFNTGKLNSRCAEFIYEMYKSIYPFLESLKKDFEKDSSKRFSYYFIESEFSKEEKQLFHKFSEEYITKQISKMIKPSLVFQDAKKCFLQFKHSISNKKIDKINLKYNLLKDFSEITNFEFVLFLKKFDYTFKGGYTSISPTFRSVFDSILIDDLIKLHSIITRITVKPELISILNVYKGYRQLKGVTDKSIKSFFYAINYLKSSSFLTDTIKYLLKDFKYKTEVKFSSSDIFIVYMSDITQLFKSEMDSINKTIRNQDISSIKNRLFPGIEIIRLDNINSPIGGNINGYLKLYDMLCLDFLDYLEYIQTFSVEIYNKLYREALNELFLMSEFVTKGKSANAFDAFYTLDEIQNKIALINMSSESENIKRLAGLLTSKTKAINNRESIESIVKYYNDNANEILIDVYRSIIDITTIIKNISEDYVSKTQVAIVNANKIKNLREFNLDIAQSIEKDFDLLIALLQNFVR